MSPGPHGQTLLEPLYRLRCTCYQICLLWGFEKWIWNKNSFLGGCHFCIKHCLCWIELNATGQRQARTIKSTHWQSCGTVLWGYKKEMWFKGCLYKFISANCRQVQNCKSLINANISAILEKVMNCSHSLVLFTPNRQTKNEFLRKTKTTSNIKQKNLAKQ